MTEFQLPKLDFAPDALAPAMSAETIEYHYGKHHASYVANLNALLKGSAFEGKSLEEIIAGLKAVSSTMRLSISTTVSSGNASPRMAAVVRKVLCLPQLKRRGEALTLSSLRSQNLLPATLVPAGPGL